MSDSASRLLLFANDVVLLTSLSHDLQLAVGWFAAEHEAAGMRISTSNHEATVLRLEKSEVSTPGQG